jgi:DNA-binding GntR family transcriptional regulator
MDTRNGVSLGRIERRRALDDVHAAIREAILTRRFPPGMRLNVDELAEQLGVSLTPVRSAIQLLAAEGMVDVHSRSGTYVATLSRRDLEETFDIRCALECLAAEQGAEKLTDEQIGSARRQLSVLARPVKSEAQRRAHEQANSELHQIIMEASGNKRLADMYESLQAHIAMGRLHRQDQSWQTRIELEHQEHEEIVAAMEKRDARTLAAVLRKHIMRAKTALVESLPAEE